MCVYGIHIFICIYIMYILLPSISSNNNSNINDQVRRKIFLISDIDFERFYYTKLCGMRPLSL